MVLPFSRFSIYFYEKYVKSKKCQLTAPFRPNPPLCGGCVLVAPTLTDRGDDTTGSETEIGKISIGSAPPFDRSDEII